ncbi:MAG: S8 family serine peptidase [Bacillota bacterium]
MRKHSKSISILLSFVFFVQVLTSTVIIPANTKEVLAKELPQTVAEDVYKKEPVQKMPDIVPTPSDDLLGEKVKRDKKEILVKLKDESKSDKVKNDILKKKIASKYDIKKKSQLFKLETIEINDSDNIERVLEELNSNPDVEYAQPNYELKTSDIPEDERFGEQWNLLNEGQIVSGQAGIYGKDINAVPAWDITTGIDTTVVGVIDTGIDINHPDLSNNIYINKNEIPYNAIDDDNNGFIDDINGWDFINNDSSVFDSAASDTHGTHVAGIIGASSNQAGIRGTAPNVKLLPLKFISGNTGYTSDAIEAIEYASKMGVKIINCSWGGSEYNPALYEAMKSSDILFISAAGNSSSNVFYSPVYPACFDLPNNISVAAIDNKGELAAFSNYGSKVQVAAPGANILSTLPENSYGQLSGTSMAAPHVAGIAALLKSKEAGLTSQEIAARIKNNVTVTDKLAVKVSTSGRVNAYAALANVAPQPEVEDKDDNSVNPVDINNYALSDYSAEANNKIPKPIIKSHNNFISQLNNLKLPEIASSGSGIKNLHISLVKDNYIMVTWTTDKKANTEFYYGNTRELGKSYKLDVMKNIHQVTLKVLDWKDFEYYMVKSVTEDGRTYRTEVGKISDIISTEDNSHALPPQTLAISEESYEEIGKKQSLIFQDVSTLGYIYDNGTNHDISTAQAIPVGTVFGTMGYTGETDYYAINLEAAKPYTFVLKGMAIGEDYDIALYDSNGSWKNGSYNYYNYDEVFDFVAEYTGVYYIQIKAYSYSSSSAHHNYQLMVYPSDSAPDALEPNDSSDTATLIGDNSIISATININTDEDWFAYDAPKAGKLNIVMQSIPEGVDYELQVYNDGYLAGGSYIKGNTDEKFSRLIVGPGRYYIRVYTNSGSNANDTYELKAYVSNPDEFEVNDNIYDVRYYSMPRVNIGDITWATIDSPDDVDIYQLLIDQTSEVSIKLQNLPADANYDLSLHTISIYGAKKLASSILTGNADESISLSLDSGAYYVMVDTKGGYSDKNKYLLTTNIANSASPVISGLAASADLTNGNITVTGSISSGNNKQVTVAVVDPNGEVDCYDQVTSGANGAFTSAYKTTNTVSGTYLVVARGEGVLFPSTATFSYSSQGQTLAVSSLTAAQTEFLYSNTFTVNPMSLDSTLSISDIAFTNSLDTPIFTLYPSCTIKANASVTNNSSIQKETAFIAVLYDSNKAVKDFAVSKKSVPAGGTEAISVGLYMPEDITGHYIKVFIWDSERNLRPLTGSYKFPFSAPANLAVVSKTESSVTLRWDTVNNATGYNVYRNGEKVWSTVQNSYEDTGLSLLNAYTYTVRAFDGEGNESLESDSVTATTDLILNGDRVIEGNLTVNAGVVLLNGYNLTVNGSIMQNGGEMQITGGNLTVKGDYTIGDVENNKPGSGVLTMTNPSDYVLVEGSFTMYSLESHADKLIDGILEIKGDFTQKSGSLYNFSAASDSSNHKVILSGEDTIVQTVTFDSAPYSRINTLEVNKPVDFYIFADATAMSSAVMSSSGGTVESFTVNTAVDSTPFYKELIEEFRRDHTYNYGGVNPVSGDYTFNSPTMLLKAPGFDINIGFTYNSKYEHSSEFLEDGWSINYEGWIKTKDYKDTNGIVIGKEFTVKIPGEGINSFTYVNGGFGSIGTRNTLSQLNGEYIVTTKDQRKFGYDSSYKIIWIKDRYGNRLTYTYETNRTVIRDLSSREVVSFDYDTVTGKLILITDILAGRKIQVVNVNNKIQEIIMPEGVKYTFGYDSNSKLSVVKDIEGNVLETITYKADSEGKVRVDTYEGPFGNKKVYTYGLTAKKTVISEEYDARIPLDGLVGEYRFDGNADDTSGNGHNGTPSNITYEEGKIGKSASFNGDNPNVEINALADTFSGRNPWSISAWFKHPSYSEDWHILCRGSLSDTASTDDRGVLIAINNSTAPYGKLHFKRLADTAIESDNNYDDGKWHHVAVIYDGTNLSVYIDYNAEQKTVTSTSSAPSQTVFGLGIYQNNPSWWDWKGYMDQVRIYNRALSYHEIQKLSSEFARPTTNNLVGEYKFDDNVNDTSGNGHNGTESNITYEEGKIGKCAVFNESLLSTVHVNSLAQYVNGTKPFSVAFWFKTSDPYGYFFCTSANSSNNCNALMIYLHDSKLYVERADGYQYKNGVFSSNNYNDGNWHLFVVTYNGADIILNVDNGKEIKTVLSTFSIPAHNAKMGTNYYNSGVVDYHGSLDQFRVYNHALSKEEINQYYSEPPTKSTIISYDKNYNITQVEDTEGKSQYYKYNNYGELDMHTDRNGNKTTYGLDGNGNVTKITNPNNSERKFGYDANNNIIWEKDEEGVFTQYIYKTVYEYDTLNEDSKYLSSAADRGIYLRMKARYLESKLGPTVDTKFITKETADKYAVTEYIPYATDTHQVKGLVEKIKDPMGNITTYTHESDGKIDTISETIDGNVRTTRFDYNNMGLKAYEYSPAYLRTDYYYNSNGQIETIVKNDADGSIIPVRVKSTIKFGYDSMGRRNHELSPILVDHIYSESQWVYGYRYTYYPNGKLWTVTDPQNNKTTYEYNQYGNIKTMKRMNGSIYSYDYDTLDRLTKIYFQDDAFSTKVLLEEYIYPLDAVPADPSAPNNNFITRKIHRKYLDNNEVAETTYYYDYAGRLIKKELPQNTDGTTPYIRNTYYKNGDIFTSTDIVTGSADETTSTTYYYHHKYDPALNTTYAETYAPTVLDNGTVRYSYVRVDYDKAGRKVSEKRGKEQVLKDSIPLTYITTNYEYYSNGLIKAVSDSSGRRTEYAYDDDGNLSKETVYSAYTEQKKDAIITEYVNNYLGKPDYKIQYVKKGDLQTLNSLDLQGINNKKSTVYLSDLLWESAKNVYGPVSQPVEKDMSFGDRTVVGDGGLITIGGAQYKKGIGASTGSEIVYDLHRKFETFKADIGIDDEYAGEGQVQFQVYLGQVDSSGNISYVLAKDKNNETMDITMSKGSVRSIEVDVRGKSKLKLVVNSVGTAGFVPADWANAHLLVNQIEAIVPEGGSLNDDTDIKLKTIYMYDENGNVETVITPDGVPTTYTYDDMDRQVLVNQPGFDENGNSAPIKSEARYNWEGKVESTKDANGNETIYGYNERGLLEVVKNARNERTIYQYDRAGRLTAEARIAPEDYLAGMTPSTAANRTEYKYDNMDRLKAKEFIGAENKLVETTNTDGTKTYTWQPQNVHLVLEAFEYDCNGNTIKEIGTFKYNESSTLDAQIANAEGTTYKYNYANMVETVLDPELASKLSALSIAEDKKYSIKYEYDGAGRKVAEYRTKGSSSSDRSIAKTRYEYDDAGNVLFVYVAKDIDSINSADTDETKIQTNTYDLLGNISTSKDANSNITEYYYNGFNKLRSVTYPYDDTVDKNVVTYKYDIRGNLIKQKNSMGAADIYTYDNQGRVLSHTRQKELDNGVVDTSDKAITTYRAYDKNGNLVSERDGEGTLKRSTYDALNRLERTSIEINTKTESGEEKKSLHTTIYGYDINGNQTTRTERMDIKDSAGNIIDTVENTYMDKYDSLNRLYEKLDPYNSIEKMEYVYQNDQSLNIYSYDALYNMSKSTYDLNKRLIRTVDAEGNIEDLTYDYAGNISTKTVGTDVDGNGTAKTTYYYYDHADRLQKVANDVIIIDNSGAEALLNVAVVYTYDNNGNMLLKTVGKTTDSSGNTTKGYTTAYHYNVANKVRAKVDHGASVSTPGAVETYTYYADGSLKTKLDRNGITTTYTYNCHGWLNQEKYSKLTYDETTKRLMMEEVFTQTSYGYDANGNKLNVTREDLNKLINYTYDAEGNITKTETVRTEPSKEITERTYDRLGRVETKTVSSQKSGDISPTVIGTTKYYYDIIYSDTDINTNTVHKLVAEKAVYPKDNNVTSKVYDKAGRLKYVFDGDPVSANSGKTTYNYYENGSRKSVVYPDGSKEVYTYYSNNLLKTLKNYRKNEDEASPMDTYEYTYDEANNLKTKQETVNGVDKGLTTYYYDKLNRLNKVVESNILRTTEYKYDAVGNRKCEIITYSGIVTKNTYEYQYNKNLLTSVTTEERSDLSGSSYIKKQRVNYGYDSNGNQTSVKREEYNADGSLKGTVTVSEFRYNKLNQLVATDIYDNQGQKVKTVNNAYDGEGLRVAKSVVNGTTTRYLYEYDKVVLELDGSGSEVARNIYGINLLKREVGATSYYYMYNGHADVTALINVATGNIDATYYYDAFGNIIERTGNVNNSITYAGYQYDKETEVFDADGNVQTGLYYLNARMYDPKIARFLQEDTYLGKPDDPLSLNLYTYVKNNPLIYYDPTGHYESMISYNIYEYKLGSKENFIPGYYPTAEVSTRVPLLPGQTREYKGTGSQKPTDNIDEQALFGGVVKTGFDALKEANKVISEYAAKEAAAKSATTGAKATSGATICKLALPILLLLIQTGDTYHDPDEKPQHETALPPGFIKINGQAWSSDTSFISPTEAWEIHNKKPAPIFQWHGWPIKSVSFNKTGNAGYQSSYQERYSQTPNSKGYWTGERGESKFISNNSEVNEILKSYGLDGIEYKDAIPDFSKLSWGGDIKIKNMQGGKRGRDYNFSEAYKQLSGETGISVKELKLIAKDFKLTWHECNDMETMQLIPTAVNDTFGHLGGVGEINSLNRKEETK